MSKDHEHDDSTHHGATTIRASKGGGGGRLLLGAVAAAVLVGGGYFAYKNFATPQDGAQTAYNDSYASDPYADDPLRAGPVTSDDDTLAETASTDDVAPPSATAERRAASTPARRSAARSELVPEETIGITPISVTTEAEEGDDIVVSAPRRPIWERTPTARRLSAMYPERALERGREGEARLACIVQDGGALACEKMSETPGGFGNAALRVSRTLRHAPQLADGSNAAGSPVNLRVVFRIDDENRRG